MRGISFVIFACFCCGALYSCGNKEITNADIDKFISKYRDENFSRFIGVSIFYRDSDFGEDIYMVGKQGGKHPPYIVRLNRISKEVVSIDDALLKKGNFNKYFSEDQIKNLMVKFEEYDVQGLSVDSVGNVFISPFYGEYSPALLRLNTKTNDSIVRMGYTYKLYKDNWYVDERHW